MKSIREKLPSAVPGDQGLILNAIFDALYESSEIGREVLIDTNY